MKVSYPRITVVIISRSKVENKEKNAPFWYMNVSTKYLEEA